MAHVSEIRPATNLGVTAFGAEFFVTRLSEMATTLKTRRAQHRAYRTTVNELRNLSQRELDDLGIHAENIETIARTAAYA